MNKSNYSTRELVLIALYGAIFVVVEVAQNTFTFLKMPNGGSFGLSTVVLLIASYHLGYKKGVAVSLLSVILQFFTGEMHLSTGIIGFLLDYVLAFGVYGLASIFPNYKAFYSGVLITNTIRLLLSTLSGMLFYGLTLWPSFVYNITYMLPTMIVGMVLVPIIYSNFKKHNL